MGSDPVDNTELWEETAREFYAEKMEAVAQHRRAHNRAVLAEREVARLRQRLAQWEQWRAYLIVHGMVPPPPDGLV